MNLKFSNTQLFAIILIAVIVFEIVALAFYSAQNNPSPDNNQPDPLDVGNQPTLAYTSQVDGTVVKLLPRLMFFGNTTEPDISTLDRQLLQLPGIRPENFNSYYRNDPTTGGLIYVAEVSYNQNQTNPVKIISDASGITQFSQPFGFAQALVSVPKNVSFHNNDLNLNKNHLFVDPLLATYVSVQTQANDKIQVQLDAKFQGNQLTELVSSELENPATQTQNRSATRLWSVDQLKPVLVVFADTNYSTRLEADTLKQRLSALSDINTIQLSFVPTAPLSIQFFSNDANLKTDVNELLKSSPFVKESSIRDFATGFQVLVQLNQNSDYESFKTDLASRFADKNLTENQSYSFLPFVFRLSARLDTKTTDLNATANQVKNLIGITDRIDLYQEASTSVSFIEESILDLNKGKYFLDSNTLSILVYPGKTIGQPAPILIEFATLRDKVVQVYAAREIDGTQSQTGNPTENPFLQ